MNEARGEQGVESVRDELQELKGRYQASKQEIADLTRSLKDKIATGTKEWATEHPLAAVGIVAGVAASWASFLD